MAKGLPRVEWPTLALIAGTYLIWTLAGAIIWPISPLAALGLMALATAMHSSLVHEVCHGHPTRSGMLNEALVSMNLGLIWPYRRFRSLHLRHHSNELLTDPFDDPESYYLAEFSFLRMPQWIKLVFRINNTMLGRVILGPVLGTVGLIAGDARLILGGDRDVARAWAIHLLAIVPVVLAVMLWFKIPLWLYLLAVVWPAHGIISVRTYAEHRWHEDPEGRSILVERTPLSVLFLNNNLHVVHHDQPQVPWYALPDVYRRDAAEWQARNGGYVYRNYWQLFRAHALRSKEPVVHPALGRGHRQ